MSEGSGEWVSSHRLRPTDSDPGQLPSSQSDATGPVPVPALGADSQLHLFGLPQARNAVCGMAAATGPDHVELEQVPGDPVVGDGDLVVTCPGCLDWLLSNTEPS